MAFRPTSAFLKELDDPNVVQAVLDHGPWSVSSVSNYDQTWPTVLPSNQEALYKRGVEGAVAVARLTTDPHFLDLASRDGRLTVREALLENPAASADNVLLLAQRASRRSSPQGVLVSTAIAKCLTARQALDILNDEKFNPASVERDSDVGTELARRILEEPDYVSLIREAVDGRNSGKYLTAASVAKAAGAFQPGGVQRLVEELEARPNVALSWFLAAAHKAPASITPEDVEKVFLPNITATPYHLVTPNFLELPLDILCMMWAPGLLRAGSVAKAMFATARYGEREDAVELLELAVDFCEGVTDEQLNDSAITQNLRELAMLPGISYPPELLSRVSGVLLRCEDPDGTNLLGFVYSVVAMPAGVLAMLPDDFLDPVFDRIPWGARGHQFRGIRGRVSHEIQRRLPLMEWAKGELPLKPTAAALAATFREVNPGTRFTGESVGAYLIESLDTDSFVAGLDASGTAPCIEHAAVARAFKLFFGNDTGAWKLGLSMLDDGVDGTGNLTLTDIARTACVLAGIEPVYLNTPDPVEAEEPEPEVDTPAEEPAEASPDEDAAEDVPSEEPLEEEIIPEESEPAPEAEPELTEDAAEEDDGRKTPAAIVCDGVQYGFDF